MAAELVYLSRATDCGIVIVNNKSIITIIDLWFEAWINAVKRSS